MSAAFDFEDDLSFAYMDETPVPELGGWHPDHHLDASVGWSVSRVAYLMRRWAEGATGQEIATELGGVTRSAVLGKVNKLGLKRGAQGRGARPRLSRGQAEESARLWADKHGSHVRKAYAALGDDTSFSRFVKIKGGVRKPPPKQLTMEGRHPAFIEGRSIFSKKGVKSLDQLKNLLVSGQSNVKIGNDVRKGHFRGYHIFTLSLEERATCPRSCANWTTCYGNNMPYARRVGVTTDNRREFEQRLEAELVGLLKKPWAGVLVRLHALGDFFDEQYVEFWGNMLAKYERLAIYGYTARRPDDQIGGEILTLKNVYGRRFAVRWSDGNYGRDCTVSILTEDQRPATAFVCPEQTGKADACGKCGACWTGDKNVAFLIH